MSATKTKVQPLSLFEAADSWSMFLVSQGLDANLPYVLFVQSFGVESSAEAIFFVDSCNSCGVMTQGNWFVAGSTRHPTILFYSNNYRKYLPPYSFCCRNLQLKLKFPSHPGLISATCMHKDENLWSLDLYLVTRESFSTHFNLQPVHSELFAFLCACHSRHPPFLEYEILHAT